MSASRRWKTAVAVKNVSLVRCSNQSNNSLTACSVVPLDTNAFVAGRFEESTSALTTERKPCFLVVRTFLAALLRSSLITVLMNIFQ